MRSIIGIAAVASGVLLLSCCFPATLGPGVSNGLDGVPEVKENGNTSNVGNDARIDVYIPRKCNGQMIVVCPGGGHGWGFTTVENTGKDRLGERQRAEFFATLERWLEDRRNEINRI